MVSGRKSSGAASLRNTFCLSIGLMSRQNSIPAAGSGVTMEPPCSGRCRADVASLRCAATGRGSRRRDQPSAALRSGAVRFSRPSEAQARRAGGAAHRETTRCLPEGPSSTKRPALLLHTAGAARRRLAALRLVLSLATGRLGRSHLYAETGSVGLSVSLPAGPTTLAWDGEIGPGSARLRFGPRHWAMTVYRPDVRPFP